MKFLMMSKLSYSVSFGLHIVNANLQENVSIFYFYFLVTFYFYFALKIAWFWLVSTLSMNKILGWYKHFWIHMFYSNYFNESPVTTSILFRTKWQKGMHNAAKMQGLKIRDIFAHNVCYNFYYFFGGGGEQYKTVLVKNRNKNYLWKEI